MAINVVKTVDVASGNIPNSPMEGCQRVFVKNSHRLTSGLEKNNSDSFPSSNTMPMVVSMDTKPQKKRKPWINVSFHRFLFFKKSGTSVWEFTLLKVSGWFMVCSCIWVPFL